MQEKLPRFAEQWEVVGGWREMREGKSKSKKSKKPCYGFVSRRARWGKGKREVSLTLNTSGAAEPLEPREAERKTQPCTSESWPCLFCWETPTRGDRTQL